MIRGCQGPQAAPRFFGRRDDCTSRNKEASALHELPDVRTGWRDSPVVITWRHTVDFVSLAANLAVKENVAKVFVARNLHPVLYDSFLSWPLDGRRETQRRRTTLLRDTGTQDYEE